MSTETECKAMEFEAVKRQLDPAFEYLVFQFSTSADKTRITGDIHGVVSGLVDSIAASELCRDHNREAFLLVFKLAPPTLSDVEEEVLTARIPDNVAYYRFRRPADRGPPW
jgi:hypothetical protein